MRVLIGLLMAASLTGLAPVRELEELNPSGLSGVAPWNSPEISMRQHQGNWIVAFTGGSRGRTAIYLRQFSIAEASWSVVESISPVDNRDDFQPSLWVDDDGTLHCVWTTLVRKAVYEVSYSRRDPGAEAWARPHRFSAGTGLVPAHIFGDGRGTLLVSSWNKLTKEPRARVLVFVSHDAGRTWAASDPNFPVDKHRGSSDLQAALLPDGNLALLWLDQTLGGRSVVFNRSFDRGMRWLDQPQPVHSDRGPAYSDPRLLIDGGIVHALWTLRARGARGPEVQIWTAHSRDQGKSFSGGRRLYTTTHRISGHELFADSRGRVGVVWSEKLAPKPDRSPGGGRLVEGLFWGPEGDLEEPVLTELAASSESSYADLELAHGGDSRLVMAAELDPFNPARVLVLARRGDSAWESLTLRALESTFDARRPLALSQESDALYTIVFHEVRRKQFIMEPAEWMTNILWGQFRFRDIEALR